MLSFRCIEGCDLSCNLHTGVRIARIDVVEEDLLLRNILHVHMDGPEKRRRLELLLREEEEYLKLQMYLRDNRFTALEGDTNHRSQLHKTILDMLHCPMRTNEKVLTLLYEQVLQGSHKAQASVVLNELTPIIRRLGSLGELWTHKFDDDKTKVISKFKMPYDQSRKIFAVEQLDGLREAVYVAISPDEEQLRKDWMSFLSEYVHINSFLHRTEEYTPADVDRLAQHIDDCYELLVTRIGGAERGVTNYFHYMGSGHLLWMISRYGNLWRYCNEGVESLNNVVSKRYNQFNNKGGNKQSKVGGPKLKCLPFEVIGRWLGRLTTWHTGLAVDMFHDLAWDTVQWTTDSKTMWNTSQQCYEFNYDVVIDCTYDSDTEWVPVIVLDGVEVELSDASDSDEDEAVWGNLTEDYSWMVNTELMYTWTVTEAGSKYSKRTRYQNRPVLPIDLS